MAVCQHPVCITGQAGYFGLKEESNNFSCFFLCGCFSGLKPACAFFIIFFEHHCSSAAWRSILGCPLASHEPISDFPSAVSQDKFRTADTLGGAGSEPLPAAIQCSMRSTLHPQHGLLQPGPMQLISLCRQCRVELLSPRRLGRKGGVSDHCGMSCASHRASLQPICCWACGGVLEGEVEPP